MLNEQQQKNEINDIFAEIAFGLMEKKDNEEAENIKTNEHISHALGRLALFAFSHNIIDGNMQLLVPECESDLREQILTVPVSLWIRNTWGIEWAEKLACRYPAMLQTDADGKTVITGDVSDISQQYGGTMENQQRKAYETIWQAALEGSCQKLYVFARKYPVEHPIVTGGEMKKFKYDLFKICNNWETVDRIAEHLYERVPDNAIKICSDCGWTVTEYRHSLRCVRDECIFNTNYFADCMEIDNIMNKFRVKPGIQRYFCIPGKLEMAIDSAAKKKGLRTELWPQLDTYDIKIIFQDGYEIWVDAKDVRDPHMLSDALLKNPPFSESLLRMTGSEYEAYIVIPDNLQARTRDYTYIINIVLDELTEGRVKCITMKQLLKLIDMRLEMN